MSKFTHLDERERFAIALCIREQYGVRATARILGRAPSTVSREIKRGSVFNLAEGTSNYDVDFAQSEAMRCSLEHGAPLKLSGDEQGVNAIADNIKVRHMSPYAAIECAVQEGQLKERICVNTVYEYIRRGLIPVDEKYLVYGFRRHEEKVEFACRKDMKGRPPELSISARPKEVLTRKEFGHWEGDLIVGARPSKAAVLTLVERKTRKLLALKIPDRSQFSVQRGLDLYERLYGDMFDKVFKSITFDNGIEFNNPDIIRCSVFEEKRKRSKTGGRFEHLYYAHPYCSSERGSNENANRMMRRRFPKSTVFDRVSEKEIVQQANWVNNYPRAIFNGRTANMLFSEELRLCLVT